MEQGDSASGSKPKADKAAARSPGNAQPAKGNQAPPQIPDHTLLRCIGGGSYGQVWLARNIMGTYRAVKLIYRSNFDFSRPFEREFHGIEKYEPVSRSHERLMDALQVGRNEAEGYFYYVMELADPVVEGQPGSIPPPIDPETYEPRTLQSDLLSGNRLPVDQCVGIGLALTEALGHLHRHGLVHRDVKPSNVIFVNGQPKLADIGLVTELDSTRSFVGTEGFVPPEGPGTPQADLYSLGKVLYEISTAKDRQAFPDLPTDLRGAEHRSDLLELNEVVTKACASDPGKRYQAAEEMQVELELLQTGKSVKQVRRLEKGVAQLKKVAVAISIVALLAGAFGFQAWKAAKNSRENLSRELVRRGVELMDKGEWFLSLLHLTTALELVKNDAHREEIHGRRIVTVLGRCPWPVGFFYHEEGGGD